MTRNPTQDLGDNVRRLREEVGWTQDHLAEVSDITPRTVQRIENGEGARFETVMALACAFGVEWAELTRPDPQALLHNFFESWHREEPIQRALREMAGRAPGVEDHCTIVRVVGVAETANMLWPTLLKRWRELGGSAADFPIDFSEGLWDMTEHAACTFYTALHRSQAEQQA